MIKENLNYALRNIRYRKTRSWLTIIGVIIGIAAIVALISLGEGLENAVEEQFEKMGVNSIRVVPKGFRGPSAGVEGLTENDVDVIENIPGVDYAESILIERVKVEFGNEEIYSQVYGSPMDKSDEVFADLNLVFDEGRKYNSGEEDSIIIGYNLAHDKFKKDVKLRNNLMIEGKKFKVVGIIEKTGLDFDSGMYMSIGSLREITDADKNKVSIIRVQLLDGEDINKIGKTIEQKLKRSRGDETFEVFTPEQLLSQIGSILAIIRFILAGIAGISLAVGGVGIMNSMYTSVKERTRDIGVMKAIGATNANIAIMFLFESGFVGLIGGAVGAIIGTMMAFSVEIIASQLGFGLISIQVNYKLIAFALFFAFFVGIISGLLPAIRATKLVPVEALRYE